MEHLTLWGSFAAAAALIVLAGIRLTRCGDILAEKFGLSHAFIGMIFVGWATSLPELVTTIAAAAREGAPSMAVSNLTGSCSFNMLVIVLLDLASGKRGFIGRMEKTGAMPVALWSLVMLASGGIAMVMPTRPLPGGVGTGTLFLILLYLLSTRHLYRVEKRQAKRLEKVELVPTYAHRTLPGVIAEAGIAAAVVVAAGIWAADLADTIGDAYGLAKSFMGAIFLAIITSLPEVATGLAAVRMRIPEMAIGSLFGSTIFNIAITFPTDLFYRKGSGDLLADAMAAEGPAKMLLPVVLAILMTGIGTLGLRLRTSRTFLLLDGISWGLVIVYTVGSYIVWAM